MESVLGKVCDKPSKARAIILRNNGIKKRYYAYKDGKSTHTNAAMVVEAIKMRSRHGKLRGEAFVRDKLVAEAEIFSTIVDRGE